MASFITTPRVIPEGQKFVTSDYRALETDKFVFFTNDGEGPITIYLPNAAHFQKISIISRLGGAAVVPLTSDSIEGGEYPLFSSYSSVTLISDGINTQHIIGEQAAGGPT